MDIVSEEKDGSIYLNLPAKLALPQSVQLRDHLIKAASDNQSVVIDCKSVQDIKTPFIQSLIAGFKHFQSTNTPLKTLNLNSCIEGAFLDLGLQAEFNLVKGI